MTDPTKDAEPTPSKEALEAAREAYRQGKYYNDVIGEFALALDRFRVAGVREERDRCFQWAIGRRSRSRAAQAIRDGENPNGHPLDPSLCWRCGVTLHPGHDCSGAFP